MTTTKPTGSAPTKLGTPRQVQAALQQLSAPARRCVELLSVLFAPATRSEVCSCLNRLRVFDSKGRKFTTRSVVASLDEPERQGLVVRDAHFECPAEVMDHVTRSALQAGTFDAIADAVERQRSGKGRRERYEDGISLIRLRLYRGDFDGMWAEHQRVVARHPAVAAR